METTWQIFGQLQPAPNVSTQTIKSVLSDLNRWIEVYEDPDSKIDLVFCDDESECFVSDLEKLLAPLCAWARLEIARTCDDLRFCAVLKNGVFQEHEAVPITLYEGLEDEFVAQLPDGIVRKVLERRIPPDRHQQDQDQKEILSLQTWLDDLLSQSAGNPNRKIKRINKELLGQIMDLFEDWLQEHSVSPQPEGEVVLKGAAYDALAKDLAGLLVNWARETGDGLSVPIYCNQAGEPVRELSELHVPTPAGPILAKVLPDSEYPGILVCNDSPGEGQPGAILEYSPTAEGDKKSLMQLRVYGREHPDDDPVAIYEMSADMRKEKTDI